MDEGSFEDDGFTDADARLDHCRFPDGDIRSELIEETNRKLSLPFKTANGSEL